MAHDFCESDHPRRPKGVRGGGQFTEKNTHSPSAIHLTSIGWPRSSYHMDRDIEKDILSPDVIDEWFPDRSEEERDELIAHIDDRLTELFERHGIVYVSRGHYFVEAGTRREEMDEEEKEEILSEMRDIYSECFGF